MRLLTVIVPIVLTALIGCDRTPSAVAPKQVTVFAAASTTDVLGELAKRYEAINGVKVVCSFDSSSNLGRQLKSGAPADIFISADEKWMDDVAAVGAIQADTRESLLGNELVVIAPVGAPFEVRMTKDFDFAAALPQVKRIAVGDPAHVPAGRYAQQSLEWLGWWTSLKGSLIPAQDVRAALRLVEIGEADAGLVYSTDAHRSTKVTVVAIFPTESHEPIRYLIAVCTGAAADASGFLEFLHGAEAAAVFERAGFSVFPREAGH